MSTDSPSAKTKCEECGTDLPVNAPQGLCPRCLASLGLDLALQNLSTIPILSVEQAGDRIERYKLLQQIGEGGCGIVYMAEQEEPVRRRVALKVIKLGMDTKQVIARFEAERQALAMMDHPHIAKVLDAGTTETGRPYFVMELVRGIKITDYCDQNNLSAAQRLELFVPVCKAIQHAHQKGIIHRDIKPSNILVTLHDGVPVPKVIDFGIAKATQGRLTDHTLFTAFEQFIGTPAYMSPEQAEMSGLDIDTRSDVYSLGVLLYELLTGKTPFDAKELLAGSLDEMRRTIREREPQRPSTRLSTMLAADLSGVAKHRQAEPGKLAGLIRGDLDWIVMKALEKDRTRRYETANGLAMDVQRYLENEPVMARPPSQWYRTQKLVRRHKLAFGAGSAVVAALVIGLGVSTSLFIQERQSRKRAVAAESEQVRLRKEAEAAGQNEALLRERAQSGEQKARSEAIKSQQVAQFLKEMLQGVGPSVALGRDTTMLREILEKTAGRLGPDLKDQPEVEAELRTVIGSVHYELFDLEKAEEMFRQALAIRRSALIEDTLVAKSAYDLGRVLLREGTITGLKAIRQKQRAEAKSLFEEALAMNRKLLGNENPEVAKCLSEVAYGLMASDWSDVHVAQAEVMIREALAMQRKLLGGTNRDVARSLETLCTIRSEKHDLVEAEALRREVLDIYRNLFGAEHPQVARNLSALADLLNSTGKPAEAEAAWRRALAMQRLFVGEENFFRRMTRDSLIELLKGQGRTAEVEQLLQQEVVWARNRYGEASEKIAQPIGRLGDFLLDQHEFSKAEELVDKVLTPVIVNQPKSTLLVRARGDIRARLGRWREAEADFSKALELKPGDSWTYIRLATLLVECGDVKAYRELCSKLPLSFRDTEDLDTAQTVVRTRLLLPGSGTGLDLENKLCRLMIDTGAGHPAEAYFPFCRGLTEYRQGNFNDAEHWLRQCSEATNSWPELRVSSYMVQAMAHHALNQDEPAMAALSAGKELAQHKLQKLENGEVGYEWIDWLMAHALMREAQGLFTDSAKPLQ